MEQKFVSTCNVDFMTHAKSSSPTLGAFKDSASSATTAMTIPCGLRLENLSQVGGVELRRWKSTG